MREQNYQSWQLEPGRSGDVALLPGMKPDIILDRRQDRRIVIDTKFTSITKTNQFGDLKLSSSYVYQIYAYLMSQEASGIEPKSNSFARPSVVQRTLHRPRSSTGFCDNCRKFANVKVSAMTARQPSVPKRIIGTCLSFV